MTKNDREEATIELLGACREFARKYWQILVLVGASIGIFYEHKEAVGDLKATLARLREDHDSLLREYRDYHSVSPDGFSNPQVRLALDKYVAGLLRIYDQEIEARARHWRNLYFQLNPEHRRPAE
jgi:hypothetical protein